MNTRNWDYAVSVLCDFASTSEDVVDRVEFAYGLSETNIEENKEPTAENMRLSGKFIPSTQEQPGLFEPSSFSIEIPATSTPYSGHYYTDRNSDGLFDTYRRFHVDGSYDLFISRESKWLRVETMEAGVATPHVSENHSGKYVWNGSAWAPL